MPDFAAYTVRQIKVDDVSRLRELLKVFGTAFEDADSYENNPPSETYLKGLLESDNFIALIALQNETVVGGLVAYELRKFEQQRSEVYIYDLAVASEHRRRGIATKIIHELMTIAKQRGAYVIYVQADLGDEPAIALYTKLGAREDVLHFDIPVE